MSVRSLPPRPRLDQLKRPATELLRRHPDQVARAPLADIARVRAVEVVGDPAADPVELDAEDENSPIWPASAGR